MGNTDDQIYEQKHNELTNKLRSKETLEDADYDSLKELSENLLTKNDAHNVMRNMLMPLLKKDNEEFNSLLTIDPLNDSTHSSQLDPLKYTVYIYKYMLQKILDEDSTIKYFNDLLPPIFLYNNKELQLHLRNQKELRLLFYKAKALCLLDTSISRRLKNKILICCNDNLFTDLYKNLSKQESSTTETIASDPSSSTDQLNEITAIEKKVLEIRKNLVDPKGIKFLDQINSGSSIELYDKLASTVKSYTALESSLFSQRKNFILTITISLIIAVPTIIGLIFQIQSTLINKIKENIVQCIVMSAIIVTCILASIFSLVYLIEKHRKIKEDITDHIKTFKRSIISSKSDDIAIISLLKKYQNNKELTESIIKLKKTNNNRDKYLTVAGSILLWSVLIFKVPSLALFMTGLDIIHIESKDHSHILKIVLLAIMGIILLFSFVCIVVFLSLALNSQVQSYKLNKSIQCKKDDLLNENSDKLYLTEEYKKIKQYRNYKKALPLISLPIIIILGIISVVVLTILSVQVKIFSFFKSRELLKNLIITAVMLSFVVLIELILIVTSIVSYIILSVAIKNLDSTMQKEIIANNQDDNINEQKFDAETFDQIHVLYCTEILSNDNEPSKEQGSEPVK